MTHTKIENRLENFGGFIYKHPKKIILFILLLILLPLSNLSTLKMDTSNEGFLHDNSPVLKDYYRFKDQFGRDERAIIAIESDKIFTKEFLQKLKNLQEEIEEKVPFVEDVTSLINVRNTYGEGDSLIVDDLVKEMPTTKEGFLKIQKAALKSKLYKNLLINESGTMTTIVIETVATISKSQSDEESLDSFDDEEEPATQEPVVYLSDAQNSEFVAKLLEVVQKYKSDDFKMHIAGSTVVVDALKQNMQKDMQKFMKITFLIIMIFLFVMFRRVSALVYPLIVIALSLLATLGLMSFFNIAFKLPTQILPSLLLAVSVGATVHMLSIFFDKFNQNGDKEEAIKYTLGHSGLAIIMTSVTTAVGVGSFAGSGVAPISDMGIFASLGVLISLILTLILLPALLSVTKLKPKKSATHSFSKFDHKMEQLALIPIKHYKLIIGISSVLILLALFFGSKVVLSHNPLKWFPQTDANRVSTELLDEKMKGTVTVEVIIDTKKENGWYDPKRLAKLDEVTGEMAHYENGDYKVGKVMSLIDVMKETNRALHANKESEYKVPTDYNLIAQELLLFENSGSDDLEDLVDSQFSQTRVTIKLPWLDAIKSEPVIVHIKDTFSKAFPDDVVTATGVVILLNETLGQSVKSSVTSYIIAYSAIAVLMVIILGGVRLGLLSMIPNLAPIIIGLLIMYFGNIPLDMFTLLIGSIAIGLAVDDTIHFLHNYRRYYKKTGDEAEAIKHTFLTTGKAMVITTLVLSLGFFSYTQAYMLSTFNFGLLTGSVIIIALFADLLFVPALMMVVSKRGWIK